MKIDFLIATLTFMILSVGISGCITDDNKDQIKSPEIEIISLKDLEENLNEYVGKNITIQGYIKQAQGENASQLYVTSLCNSNYSYSEYCCLLYVPLNVFINTGKYQITGTVGIQEKINIPTINVLSAKPLY